MKNNGRPEIPKSREEYWSYSSGVGQRANLPGVVDFSLFILDDNSSYILS